MKRFVRVFFAIMFVFCFILSLTLSAGALSSESSEIKDGLAISITTDKENYISGEEIQMNVKIKNTNDEIMSGISLEALIPDGFSLKIGEKSQKDIAIDAGKEFSSSYTVVFGSSSDEDDGKDGHKSTPETASDNNSQSQSATSPQTNDNTNLILWIIISSVSFIGLVVLVTVLIRKKKGVKILSLFICVALVAIILPYTALVADAAQTAVSVHKTVNYAGKDVKFEVAVSYSAVDSDASEFTVSFDLNYEGITEKIASQTIAKNECAVEPEVPERTGFILTGWNLDKDSKDYNNSFDFDTPIKSSITLYAIWISDVDTDGDRLFDDLEKVYGTDINNIDTDKDKLDDYAEIFIFGTNPLKADTDDNGVIDGDEDLDIDNLSNADEIKLGTRPNYDDTDGDYLTDGQEVNQHGTDPLSVDTDSDGASDGKEVEYGTNPLVAETDFSISLKGDAEDDSVKPSVDLVLTGEQVDTLSIDKVEDEVLFPEDMPGYMGSAYDFSVEGQIKGATISFEFDNSDADEDLDPVIYYFNEEEQKLEELDTTVNGNVASAEVSHFSKYILINRKVYREKFEWIDNWESEKNYTGADVVLVVDDSGSMEDNDYSYQRLSVSRNLVDKLPKNSRIGVVKFSSSTTVLTESLTDDRDEVKGYLSQTYFNSYGTTYMYTAMNTSLSYYGEDESIMKVMVVLSDGEAHDTSKHNSTIQKAIENGVKIFTVGLGRDEYYFNRYLKPLAEETGGTFYYANNADQLAEIYESIGEKIDIETDSDNDGVPDYYEDKMISFNGVTTPLDKNNPDTDGDGLKDGEEAVLTYEYNEDRTKVKVTGKLVLGNPGKKDTDDDGYTDDVDNSPFKPYKTPIILLHGLNDNTTCYGVSTNITKDMNTNYGSEFTDASSNGTVYDYSSCISHKIKSVNNGRLGSYLVRELDYTKNKTLFAFNYANSDMVQFNANRLNKYINSLIDAAKNERSKDVVDQEYLFATKGDKKQGKVKFILIGHSMGGLVSRYYIENIGTSYVDKLITIDTPHYGSGLANLSDATGDFIRFCPSIFDLDTGSTLYGGSRRHIDFTLGGIFRGDSKYALQNQSPALKGNRGVSADYYAVGGYTVDRGFLLDKGNLGRIASSLRNTIFSFEFDRKTNNKDDYKTSINAALVNFSNDYCGESSSLDLGDSGGDSVVDYMSQFAVRFNGKNVDSQELERTIMVVNTRDNPSMLNSFHNNIHTEFEMHNAVVKFIND